MPALVITSSWVVLAVQDQNINGALNFVSIAPSKRPGEPAHWEIVRWNEAAHLESVGFLESAFGGGAESG